MGFTFTDKWANLFRTLKLEKMLINKYTSEFQFKEVHKTFVNTTAYDAYRTTMELDLSKSKVTETLFRLRGLPFNNNTFTTINSDMRFTLLEEIPCSKFLYGFWFSTKTEWVADLNEFIKNSTKYNAKVGWSFYFDERTDGRTEITTETRVLCLNKTTKFVFSIYWSFIRPFSGLIRLEILRLINKKLTNDKN